MSKISHTHDAFAEPCVWHDGSLADCPETVWDDVLTTDGKPARLARGMSVSMPPETTQRLRYVDETETEGSKG